MQRDRREMPPKSAIAEHWSKDREQPFAIDLGEPACFGCGWYEEGWDEPSTWHGRWAKANLERAHLVDRHLGGPDDASNLVLLCHRCHSPMPIFSPGEGHVAIRWVQRREPYTVGIAREMRTWAEQDWLDWATKLGLDMDPAMIPGAVALMREGYCPRRLARAQA